MNPLKTVMPARRSHRRRLVIGVVAVALTLLQAPYAAVGAPKSADRSVTASLSKARTVAGRKVTVSGSVVGGSPSTRVTLMQQLADGWHPVRSATTRKGRFTIAVPTSWYNRHRLAVRANATNTHTAVMSRPVTLSVVPGYKPRGRASAYRSFGGDAPTRWNPCEVITYRVNRNRLPRGAMKDVRGAFRRIHAASGLRFRYVGRSRHVPWATKPGRREKGTDIVIAWATPRQVPELAGGVAGVGGAWFYPSEDANGPVNEMFDGSVTLDATQKLAGPGFGRGGTRGALLLHEIGHALGMGHVNDPTQLMYPQMTRAHARFGAGDLSLLNQIGMAGGCIKAENPWARLTPRPLVRR